MISKARKQKYLNTFIKRVNGKGQSIDTDTHYCVYVLKGHPGCAIGCQPEVKPFKKILETQENTNIIQLCGLTSLGTKFRNALGVSDDIHSEQYQKDTSFLASLQRLHDGSENWDSDVTKLRQAAVEHFCKGWNLTVPKSDYAQQQNQEN